MNKTISLVLVSLLFFGLADWVFADSTLPSNYPSDVLPLVADAKILDVRENPAYAGENSVYIVITGLPGANAAPERAKEQGETWPAEELPGVPELFGVIDYLLVEAGGIYLEIIVENASVVKQYLNELQDAGFSFDEAPDLGSEHIQLLAFGETGILNFAYKAVENRVFLEFQK